MFRILGAVSSQGSKEICRDREDRWRTQPPEKFWVKRAPPLHSATSKTPGRFGNKFIAARYAAEGAELVMGERESPGPEASTSRLIPQKRIDGNV